jgi:hypothetical protein
LFCRLGVHRSSVKKQGRKNQLVSHFTLGPHALNHGSRTKTVITRKPSWLTGIVLPVLAGSVVGYTFLPSTSLWGWYLLSGWLFMCGFAVIFERAPVYGATSIPQSRRLCELYGVQWLVMGVLTILAAWELPQAQQAADNANAGSLSYLSSLPVVVLLANLVCTFAFSIAAGPTRLVNANDNEMVLIPTNSFLVAAMTASLILY